MAVMYFHSLQSLNVSSRGGICYSGGPYRRRYRINNRFSVSASIGKNYQDVSLESKVPLIKQVVDNWKPRLLQAFTKVFKNCNPESSLKLACLSAVEEMLVPKQGCVHLDTSDPEILDYQITWIRDTFVANPLRR